MLCVLTALLAIQCSSAFGISCPDNSQRFCKNNVFTPEFDYEFFEGSLPVSMIGVYFKQYSSEDADQIDLDFGHKTQEVT